MANSEALQKYAKTKEGYNYLSQFAYEGQTIVINGQEFAFEKAGDYSHQNLKFIGSDPKYTGETIPVNSVGGLDLKYYVGVDGVQSYELYVANNMSISHQMDTFFHEVQHAFMFASGGFRGYTGRGTPTIAAFHHGAMMQGSLWEDHANFINQANNQFNVGISVNTVWYNTLGYTLPQKIANKVRNNIKIRY
jgi:hypothetical protein